MTSLSISAACESTVNERANKRVRREVVLRSAFDAPSPSVISGEARVKVDVERMGSWKVLIATLVGVAFSVALTFCGTHIITVIS